MPPHPSTSEGSALRKPRAKQGNRFLAHPLPSTARRRTPARCCTRCLAYAPTTTSLARYSAGRAKQHNHARNVKPLPPRRSPGRTLPGQEGVKGDTCLSPSPFSLPFGKKRKKHRPSMRCRLNKHRTLHLLSPCLSFLLSPCLSFLLSPCLSFLLSPCLSFLLSPCLSFLPSPCLSFLPSACFSFLLSPSPHTPPRQAKKSP